MNIKRYFESYRLIEGPSELEHQFATDQDLAGKIEPHHVVIRSWVVHGVMVGKLDTLLPKYPIARRGLIDEGYAVSVRKAGGLAVIGDDGVLNLTIMYSKNHPLIGDLQSSYGFASEWLKCMLEFLKLPIEVGEVKNAYCPGDFDLSVHGKKIAGMAQYRSKNAVMIMITLFVSGDQTQRCRVLKRFYVAAGESPTVTKPNINEQSMTTLEAITGLPLTPQNVVTSMKTKMIEMMNEKIDA